MVTTCNTCSDLVKPKQPVQALLCVHVVPRKSQVMLDICHCSNVGNLLAASNGVNAGQCRLVDIADGCADLAATHSGVFQLFPAS